MHDINAGVDRSTAPDLRILAPAERLLDALVDPARRDRAVAVLLVSFVVLWTLYGVLAHGGYDVNWDVAQALLWSREPALQHHPPVLAWVYKAWFILFPVADWASYLLAATVVGITLWFVWLLLGDWLDARKRVVGLALLTLVPLYTFHATKLNANTVMMPFWAAATLFFLRSFRSRGRAEAALAGLAGAGAVLAKYWSFFLVAGFGLAALLNPDRARYFRSSAPWISIGIGAALLLPHALDLADNPHALAFAEQTGIAPGIWRTMLQSLKYLGGTLGHAAIPILLLITMRPSRTAIADVLAPASAERRLVAVVFWLPLLLPALVNLVMPHRLTPLWTIPNWSLLPVVLLGSSLVVVERRMAVRVLALALVVPLLAVLAAPVLALVNHRSGASDGNARLSLMAEALDRAWREATPRPLRLIGGQPRLIVRMAFYTTPEARFLWAIERTPQVLAAIAKDGAAFVCQASDRACLEWIDYLGAARGRRSEVELARSYLGIEGRRERFVIVILPPAS
jgi:4-amino-4-deoxy-L-arabinose transferase-like glycosyltransferase